MNRQISIVQQEMESDQEVFILFDDDCLICFVRINC